MIDHEYYDQSIKFILNANDWKNSFFKFDQDRRHFEEKYSGNRELFKYFI